MSATDPQSPDLSAAELALGLLEGDERATALRRTLAEPDFAEDVARWRRRFERLFTAWPEAQPPPDLKRRLLARVAGPRDARRSLRLWRGAAIAASAIAASLLVLLVSSRSAPPPESPVQSQIAESPRPAPILLAVLTPKDSAPLPALYEIALGRLRVGADLPVDSGRSAQLWVIPTDGSPHPLGLLQADGRTILVISPDQRGWMQGGATLAISIEPPGGSPSGQPTGPVVATGTLVAS